MTDWNEPENFQEERNAQPIDETETDLARAMWLSVILQATLDAIGKTGDHNDQVKARIWLEARGGEKSDFAYVCNLAGVDFEQARKRLAKFVELKSKAIDFRCGKKANAENRSRENRHKYFKRARTNAWIRAERDERKKFIQDLVKGKLSAATVNLISEMADNDNSIGGIAANDNLINQQTDKTHEQ